jgi:hypothetical protein
VKSKDIKRFEARYLRQFQRDRADGDIFVLSYPKAGRTWHRLLVGHYLTQLCNLPARNALDLEDIWRRTGLRRLVYSHNGANFLDCLPPSHHLVASPSLWQDRDVILLVREPRDIIVSAFYHAVFRSRTFCGSLSDFVRDPIVGFEKILTAFNRWNASRALAKSFEIISYEAMHREPNVVLRKTLAALGVDEVDHNMLGKTIAFGSFENMRQCEETDFFGSTRLSKRSPDARADKGRQGKVGGYHDDLSRGDLEWIDDCIERLGDPFADSYL